MTLPAPVLPAGWGRVECSEAARLPLDGGTRSPKRPGALLAGLFVATIVDIALVFASVVPLMFSAMVFDAGGTPFAWAVFIGIWLTPVMLLAGLAIAWVAFAARAYRMVYAGFAVAALPLLAVAVWLAVSFV